VAENPNTEELRIEQAERAAEEREAAEGASTDEDTATHRRRAEKAAYLQEKLGERAQSERAPDDD
jgi:hypothetical protein